MKIKRVKRASKILTFYRFSYGFVPPYSILTDGTFTQAALQNKLNLREQLPKYLGEEVELAVTKCILNELEQLGTQVYGALAICRNFITVKCPHKPMRTAAECIGHLARRSKKADSNHPKYIIATQDETLLQKLREFGGVPLLSVKSNTIYLERPSFQTVKESEAPKPLNELSKVKELRKDVLGEEDPQPRKRKKKGANPLSCKKKKAKIATPAGGMPGAFGKQAVTKSVEEEPVQKRARRRKKKPKESETVDEE